MVRLQTLDLRIGVRVPASQPNILKDFRRSRQNPLNSLLRLCCGLSQRTGESNRSTLALPSGARRHPL